MTRHYLRSDFFSWWKITRWKLAISSRSRQLLVLHQYLVDCLRPFFHVPTRPFPAMHWPAIWYCRPAVTKIMLPNPVLCLVLGLFGLLQTSCVMSTVDRQHRRSSRQRESVPQTHSIHPSQVPIDATSVPIVVLRKALNDVRNHQELLSDLDFVDVSDDKIKRLFKNATRYDATEIIYPPRALRRTDKQIREFFNLRDQSKRRLRSKHVRMISSIHPPPSNILILFIVESWIQMTNRL